MSAIPIHTASPITASKLAGATPQTAAPDSRTTSSAPVSSPATATAPSQYAYRSAAPGAAPVPVPTSSPHHSAPQATPTPTRTWPAPSSDGPPAPQPGPRKLHADTTYTATHSVPPPPKVGETPKPAEYYAPVRTAASTNAAPPRAPYPSQFSAPPPSSAQQSYGQPPSSTTRIMNSHSSRAETGRTSMEHPYGYVQDPYATDIAYNQSQGCGGGQYNGSSSGVGYNQNQGFSSNNSGASEDWSGASMWDTAKRWAKIAGDKAIETEKEVWKRINQDR